VGPLTPAGGEVRSRAGQEKIRTRNGARSYAGVRSHLSLETLMLSIRDHLTPVGIDKWVAELGCTNAPVPRQNIQTALEFFALEMPRVKISDAVGFLAAMDLSKRVSRIVLTPGERVLGFRTPTEQPFKLFFTRRGASAHASGINVARRGPLHFVVRQNVNALESFTTGAKDTWTQTLPGQPMSIAPRAKKWFGKEFGVVAPGGGIQLIIPESYSYLLLEVS
jgi:hypothetical protein